MRSRGYREEPVMIRRGVAAGRLTGVIGRHRRMSVGLLIASATVAIIFINALFLQAGPHPAPLFVRKADAAIEPRVVKTQPVEPRRTADNMVRTISLSPLKPPTKSVAAAAPTRNEPPAKPITQPKKVLAIQHALADFGYGQIKPTGQVDAPTQAAIEKFEQDRKLPVTGQISERLARELATMTGRPLE